MLLVISIGGVTSNSVLCNSTPLARCLTLRAILLKVPRERQCLRRPNRLFPNLLRFEYLRLFPYLLLNGIF